MAKSEILENGNVRVTIPYALKLRGGQTRIILPEHSSETDVTPLLQNLARGFCWQKMIDDGTFANIKELARKIDIDPGVVAKAIRLTWLSPKIIHQIISGETDLTLGQLRQSFPALWEEQETLFLKK